MGNFPMEKAQFMPYLVVACLSIVLYFLGDMATDLSEFSRQALEHMQWWRLVTAHFVHTNGIHLLLNLTGLLLLWLLHGEYTEPRSFYLLLIILTIVVSSGVYFFSLHLASYVGLSGVLHGVFAWGVIQDIKWKRKSGYLLLLGLTIKIIEEQWFSSNELMGNLIQAKVAVDAHLYGAIGGLILAVFISPKLTPKPIA